MGLLSDSKGVADEIVVPRSHRSGYNHALRLADATLVNVGAVDRVSFCNYGLLPERSFDWVVAATAVHL